MPQQEEFWRPPVRFGSVPVEKEPLGRDRRRGFRKLFPQVMLLFQVVERVSFGHPTLEPNRLFWGDNLHVMRQPPSESIDLIYVDPPFFSGRQYNVIFGDQNELRSFSDIWLGRRWIACDQSRVAVAITADRLTRQIEEQTGKVFPVQDFTLEHWGVYEARRLAEAPPEQFRAFVLRAFGAVPEEQYGDSSPASRAQNDRGGIHGYKGAVPVWVGEPDPKKAVTAADVQTFANAIRKTLRYKQDNLRDGIMLAWAFRPDAMEAAERLRRLEQTDLNFIRLDMIRVDAPRFREHVTSLSTHHADYENFLTFVQPPKVEVGLQARRPAPGNSM